CRREGAELALHAADVRLVQVQVLDEVRLVSPAAHPPRDIGQLAELEEVVGLEDGDAVVEVEALTGLDLVPDAVQDALFDDCHHRSRSMTMCVSASSSGSSHRRARAFLA